MEEFEYEVPEDGDEEIVVNAPTSDELEAELPAWIEEAAEAELGNPQGESFESYKERRREEMNGMGLAWWQDESFATGQAVIGRVVDSAIVNVETIDALFEAGLPKDFLEQPINVNLVEGALFLSALQVLGTYEPRLRKFIEPLLERLANSVPEANEEQKEVLHSYEEAAAEIMLAQFRAEAESRGVQVTTVGELADQLVGLDPELYRDGPEVDASRN